MTGAPAAIRPPVRRDGIPAAAALRSLVPAQLPPLRKASSEAARSAGENPPPAVAPGAWTAGPRPPRRRRTRVEAASALPASRAEAPERQPAQCEQAEDAHPLANLRLHAARGRLPGLLVALLDNRLRRFQQVGLAVGRRRRAESGHPGSLVWLGWPASTRATWSGKLAMSIGLVM